MGLRIHDNNHMKKLQKLVAIVVLISLQYAHADQEVDQFTKLPGQSKLSDSSELLNAKVNQLFDLALTAANKEGRCDGKNPEESGKARTALYDALSERLAQTNSGNPISEFVDKENTIPKIVTPFEKSFYANESMKKHKIKLAHVIQFKETNFGTDKLVEFFANGYSRFRELRFNKTGDGRYKRALSASLGMEKTGESPILSWADHAARMAGYKFWDDICGSPDDSVTESEKIHFVNNGCHVGKIVTCEDGRWKRNPNRTKFDLSSYIDDSWDESVNCSQYRDEVLDGIIYKMAFANEQAKQPSTPPCPRDQTKCVNLIKKDEPTISPVCKTVATEIRAKKLPTTDLRRYLNKERHHSTYESDKTRKPIHRGVVTGS
jgi:hypothetical protein